MPGYMRLVKDRILHVWEQRRAEANERTTEQERRVKTIQQKLDRLDEAFLYSESIDLTSYSRQRDKLREELTLAQIDRHTEAVDELDVQGILVFAERILPRASDLWVQASLDYKQRLQQLFFPEGIAYDGNRFNRTAATAPLFNYLAPSESADEKMVTQTGIEPRHADARRDFGIDGRAAGASSIGRRYRRMPSYECSAPATAPAVATQPISPTPLAP